MEQGLPAASGAEGARRAPPLAPSSLRGVPAWAQGLPTAAACVRRGSASAQVWGHPSCSPSLSGASQGVSRNPKFREGAGFTRVLGLALEVGTALDAGLGQKPAPVRGWRWQVRLRLTLQSERGVESSEVGSGPRLCSQGTGRSHARLAGLASRRGRPHTRGQTRQRWLLPGRGAWRAAWGPADGCAQPPRACPGGPVPPVTHPHLSGACVGRELRERVRAQPGGLCLPSVPYRNPANVKKWLPSAQSFPDAEVF